MTVFRLSTSRPAVRMWGTGRPLLTAPRLRFLHAGSLFFERHKPDRKIQSSSCYNTQQPRCGQIETGEAVDVTEILSVAEEPGSNVMFLCKAIAETGDAIATSYIVRSSV